MLEIAELAKRTEDLKKRAVVLFNKAGKTISFTENEEKPIKLVFAGQYSAGKSSIIKMITGIDNVDVGAGITTQNVHSYMWNGIEIIDTPGIHTQLRPDHDEISYAAIASADMLVFVITNELFDSHIAKHFRSLAIDKDKAAEMLLVVNKMERTSLGNVPEQQETIKEDLRKVLVPYTPEQLNISFLDAKSYIEALTEDDSETSEELKQRSGYDIFINTLNSFVQNKNLSSRLTTPLYEIDALLDECIKEAQPTSNDSDLDALEDNYLQQRHELFDSKNRLQQAIKDIYEKGSMQLRELGMNAAGLITEQCKQEEVEQQLQGKIEKANEIIDICQENAKQTLSDRMKEIGRAIDNIEQAKFTQELIGRLSAKFDSLPENVKNMLCQGGEWAKAGGKFILDNAYKAGAEGGLKLASFSGGNVHNVILKIGHSIGYKFKPWQAVKLARGVAIGGEVLGILGVGFNVFMQIKEDRDEEKMRETIRENRQNIRGQFYTAASELSDYGSMFIKENVLSPLDDSIHTLDINITEIRNMRNGKNEYCLELEALQADCRQLINDIHRAE